MQRIPSYKEILKIAIPLMIGSISESISSCVDTAFMGRLGTLELGGMGMANIYIMMIIMIGWALSRGVQIMVSQNYGAKKDEKIADIMYNTMVAVVPIALMLMMILFFFSHDFLKLVISNPDICKISTDICKIRAIGIPIAIIIAVYSSFYTGISSTKILIYSQGVSALLNIILNYCLVFGNFGFPEWGYQGSATATVLSEVVCLSILLGSLYFNKTIIEKYNIFSIRTVKVDILKKLWELSYPLLIQFFVSLGAWVLFFTLIEKMGEKELAISLIIKQLLVLIMLPLFSLANTCNTLVGKVVGEKEIDLIPKVIIKVIKVNMALMAIFTVMTFVFRVQLVDIFTDDLFVIENISMPLLVLLFSTIFMSAGTVIFNGISALGDTKITLIIETLVIALYSVYLYLVMVIRKATLVEAWSSELVYWILMLIFTTMYFYKIDWRKKIIYLDKN